MTETQNIKLYTYTGTRRVINQVKRYDVGMLMVEGWKNPDKWPYYAIDNGAYSAFVNNREWDPIPFLRTIRRARLYERKPDFVVCPDIVAGGRDSLIHSINWLHVLPGELQYYLAVQDGMQIQEVADVIRSHGFAGIFVGGTADWKIETAPAWCILSKNLGIKCHIGRIGPGRKILWAAQIGADSVDSSTWVQREKAWRHVKYARSQQNLDETGALQ